MKKYIPITLLALSLTSCQFSFFYELERPKKEETKEESVPARQVPGVAYIDSVKACMLAKSEEDCTDEEWVEEYRDIPGQGYYDSQWSADHADQLACVTVSTTGDTYTVDQSGCVK